MKIKKEYIILVLVIVILSVYLFMRKTDRTHYELPVLPEISKKEISKIEISKGETAIVLNKKDDQWYIGPRQYPADKKKIDGMLDVFEKLTLTVSVSESKNYVRYDLNDEKKVNVKAWQDGTLKINFDVGKTAPSFRHTFVKLAEDDRVFHAQDNFRNRFDQTVDNLREKTVLSFQASDINEIQITKDQQSLTFTRTQVPAEETQQKEDKTEAPTPQSTQTVWQSADGKIGDGVALNRLFSSLSNLQCDKFIDDRKKEEFTAPLYIAQLKSAQDHTLSIFAKLNEEDTQFPATSSGSDYPFYLSKSKADQIMKDPANLLKKAETDKKKSEPQKSN
jgi:hypothetical protein